MVTLRIEHRVPDYTGWKKAFDADPLDRQASGVRHVRVHRATDDPDLVLIDLDFLSTGEAEAMLSRLRRLWAGPGGAYVLGPRATLLEGVDTTVT